MMMMKRVMIRVVVVMIMSRIMLIYEKLMATLQW